MRLQGEAYCGKAVEQLRSKYGSAWKKDPKSPSQEVLTDIFLFMQLLTILFYRYKLIYYQ